MSEGSWLPKTWTEALPQVFWGVLILGFGLEFCVSILDANYGRALLAIVGLVALLAMLIHQEQLKQRLMTVNPNWIAGALYCSWQPLFFRHSSRKNAGPSPHGFTHHPTPIRPQIPQH